MQTANRKQNPIPILILLILIPIVLILGTYFILIHTRPAKIALPPAAFLQSTEPTARFVSEISIPEQHRPANRSQQTAGPSTMEDDHVVFRAVDPLADGRLMLSGYPECYFFDQRGNLIGELQLEAPDESDLESLESVTDLNPQLIDPSNLVTSAATQSGRIFALFQDVELGPALLVEWDPQGRLTSIADVQPLFTQYYYVRPDYVSSRWRITAGEDNILLSDARGIFLVAGAPSGLLVTRYSEPVEAISPLSVMYPHGEHIYSAGPGNSTIRRRLDGSIDRDWVSRIDALGQPGLEGFGMPLGFWTFGLVCTRDGQRCMIVTPTGITELDSEANIIQVHGTAATANTLAARIRAGMMMARCMPVDDGWLLLGASNDDPPLHYAHVDTEFTFLESVWFTPPEPRADEDTARGIGAERPPAPSPVSASQFEYPLLEVGDYADPRIIWREFHPIPDGYRAVDHTLRRVITTDHDLEVVAVLDRSDPIPNGLWQNINGIQVDSSGNIYLLDTTQALVQVLDGAGNYIRRHTDLGLDLFGVPLEPDDIILDRMDRLWIVGDNRAYVIDRNGNLQRIFERRGSPYVRTPGTPGQGPPPEHTPLGYTILPSTDPIIGRRDPTSPIVLEAGEIHSFALGGDPGSLLIYIGQNTNNEVLIFDRNGNERGHIDLAALATSLNRQFVVGPDGYLYLIDPDRETVLVMDPLGDILSEIRVDGLPQDGWEWTLGPSATSADAVSAVRCFIDFDGNLVIYDGTSSEVRVYPLRSP